MAIKLLKELDNGFQADYWKIIEIKLSSGDYTITGMLVLYKDEEARQQNKAPIPPPILFSYNVNIEEWSEVLNNPFIWCYTKIKSEQLQGGEDV